MGVTLTASAGAAGIDRVEAELLGLVEFLQPGARDDLRETMDGQPGYADLKLRLAWLEFQAGRLDEAGTLVVDALRINPGYAEARHLQIMIEVAGGRLETARDIARELVQARRDDADAHYRLAVCASRLGDLEEAERHGRRTLDLAKRHEGALQLLARVRLARRDFHQARSFLLEVDRVRPNEETAYILGLIALRLEQPVESAAWFRKAIAHRPNHLNSLVRLAMLAMDRDDRDEAIAALRDAIRFHPSFPDLKLAMARLLLLTGRRAEAMAELQAALRLNPRYAGVMRTMGDLHLEGNDHEKALASFSQGLEIDPDNPDSWKELGRAHSATGDFAEAADVLERAVARFPHSWELRQELGVVALGRGERSRARIAFQEAVRINPALEALQRNLRVIHQDPDLLDEDRRRIEESFADQPGRLAFELAGLMAEFHQERTALTHYRKALELGHEPVLTRLRLGAVHGGLLEHEEAIRVLSEAPPEPFAAAPLAESVRRVLLGLFHANAGDHAGAGKYYRQVLIDAPLFVFGLDRLGVCFREPEELDELLDDYREYARYHRRHSEISRRIGEVEASRGMLIEALHHLRHADGLVANDARTEHAIGVIQLLRMELTEAEAHFRSATEHQPEGRFAWLMLAQLAEAAGRKEEARAAFGRFLELERDAHWAGLARKRLEALGG